MASKSPLAWVLEYEPYILVPGRGEIPFHPYYAQQAFLNDMSTRRILNKMRQGGFSTILAAAEAPWKMLYRNTPSIACLSKNEDDAVGFLDKFKLAYDSVKDKDPNWKKIDPKTKVARVYGEDKEMAGVIKVLSAGKGSGRSISATDVYFDEMPHAQYSDEIYTSSYPTITRIGGRITLFSTPNGKGNKFHEVCTNPQDAGYSYHQYEWWFVPDYNPAYKSFLDAYLRKDKRGMEQAIKDGRKGRWYRETLAAMGDMAFAQEYECNFDASDQQVFSTRQLNGAFRANYLSECEDEYGEVWRETSHDDHNCAGEHVTFMDYGRKRDPTIIVTLCDVSEIWRLIEFKRITPLYFVWNMVMGSFLETTQRYNSDAYHDGTGNGDAVTIECEWSTPIIISDSFQSKVKSNAIANTQRAMDNKAVVLPKLRAIYREFEQYRYNDKKLTQDIVMAVVFALYKAYDPSDSFTGVDTSFSLVGN